MEQFLLWCLKYPLEMAVSFFQQSSGSFTTSGYLQLSSSIKYLFYLFCMRMRSDYIIITNMPNIIPASFALMLVILLNLCVLALADDKVILSLVRSYPFLGSMQTIIL